MKTTRSMQRAQAQLGISKLRQHQVGPIKSILDGKDTLMIAPTSSGKSAVYQVPALVMAEENDRWTLVVEPTLSLIIDQVQKLQAKGIAAAFITSPNHAAHRQIYRDLNQGKLSILYMTPEKVATVEFQLATRDNPPWLVVVDEAHCVLDWGSTFRPDYLELGDRIAWMASENCRPVIAAFTATAPLKERDEIAKSLGMTAPSLFTMSLRRDNIILLKEDCSDYDVTYRLDRLKHYIRKYGGTGQVVVYCSSKKYADLVTNHLSKQFPHTVAKCHAYMDPDKRQKNELKFIHGDKRIMVATTAFGMGVDVSDIRLVVHFNLPLSVTDYYQQIGRAGRDGEKSHAVLLYGKEDISLNQFILCSDKCSEEVQAQSNRRLDEMIELAGSNRCMVRQVLAALGEEDAVNCNHCTNCQRARRCSHED